jgi:HK97 family phage major capsid protein
MKHFRKTVAINVMALMAAAPATVLAVRADASNELAGLRNDITGQLTRIQNELMPVAQNALDEAKRSGQVSDETKAAADKALAQQTALSASLDAINGTIEGVQGQVAEMGQILAENRSGLNRGQVMTLGRSLVENDEFKAFVDAGASGSKSITINNAITTSTAGGLLDQAPVDPDVGELGRRTFNVLSLFGRGATETSPVPFTRQTVRDNQAGMVGEGVAAPESDYEWVRDEAPVRKISHVVHVTEEMMADSSLMQSELDGEMIYGLEEKREFQLIAGNGVGENLKGTASWATDFVAAAGLPNTTRIDRLRLGLLQLALAGVFGTGILLNDTDWAAIELLKDDNGQFIYGNPSQGTVPRLWSKPVVQTLALSAGEWQVGDFSRAAKYYERKGAEILFSTEHGTNFVDGMITAKGTLRAAFADKRRHAIVQGNFTFA